jgi:hypothetical protein
MDPRQPERNAIFGQAPSRAAGETHNATSGAQRVMSSRDHSSTGASPRDQQLLKLGRLQERCDAMREQVIQREQKLLGRSRVSSSGSNTFSGSKSKKKTFPPSTDMEAVLPTPVLRSVEPLHQLAPVHSPANRRPTLPLRRGVTYGEVATLVERALSARSVMKDDLGRSGRVEPTSNLVNRPPVLASNHRRLDVRSVPMVPQRTEEDDTPECRVTTAEPSACPVGNNPACKVVMKPKTFDGRNGHLNTFLSQFENCARFNGWSELDKAAFLKNCVTNEAAQFLWDDGDSCEASYVELVVCLRRRYASPGQEERFRAELRSVRRGRGETLQTLYQSVKRLMAMAFPAEKSRCGTIVARDAFITALNDTQLERRIREREPADVEGAFNLAVKLESLDKALPYADDSGVRPRACRQVRGDDDDDVVLEVKCELEQQWQELAELRAELEVSAEQAEVSVERPPPPIDQARLLRGLEDENACLCRDVEQLRAEISSRPEPATLGRCRRKRTMKTRPFVPQFEEIEEEDELQCDEINPGGKVVRVECDDDPESTTYGVEVAGAMSEDIGIAGSGKSTDGWGGKMDVSNLDSPVRTAQARAVVIVDTGPAVDFTSCSPSIEEAAAETVILESPPARQGLTTFRHDMELGSVSGVQTEHNEKPPWTRRERLRIKNEHELRLRADGLTILSAGRCTDLDQLLQHGATGGLSYARETEQADAREGMVHKPTLTGIFRFVFDRGKPVAVAVVNGG